MSGMNLRAEQSWKEGGVAECAPVAAKSVQPLGSQHFCGIVSNIVPLAWVVHHGIYIIIPVPRVSDMIGGGG